MTNYPDRPMRSADRIYSEHKPFTLTIKVIHPPTDNLKREEIITVKLHPETTIGDAEDLVKFEQLLNRISRSRFHIEMD